MNNRKRYVILDTLFESMACRWASNDRPEVEVVVDHIDTQAKEGVMEPTSREEAQRMISVALAYLVKNEPSHQHVATGGKYLKLATGCLQVSGRATDMDQLVAYVGESGDWWFRPPGEFNSRFEELKKE